MIDHGKGCEVWDIDGNRYIDLAAGIAVCSTGHSHPDVVKAIQQQAENSSTSLRTFTILGGLIFRKLATMLPSGLQKSSW